MTLVLRDLMLQPRISETTPALRRSLEGFLALMWDAADLLAKSIELQYKQDKHMDIHAMVQAMTVQVVGTTAFG